MEIVRAHLFVMLDVAIGPTTRAVPTESLVRMRERADDGGDFAALMDAGSGWLFYGTTFVDEHGRSQPTAVLYAGSPHGGSRLTIQPELGVGVLTYWRPFETTDSPLTSQDIVTEKVRVGEDQSLLVDVVEGWGLDYDRVGRILTFVSVQVDTPDLEAFTNQHAIEIGRLFTGNIEDEVEERLAAHVVEENLSGRRFERAFVRWTDALALYDTSTPLMDPATMRLVHLTETGILTRRLLRELAFEAEQTMRQLRFWTLPVLSGPVRRAERLRRIHSETELTTSIAPPVHSIEGARLLADTLAAFQVPSLLADVRASISELERRLEWQRLRWIACLAVLAFTLNLAVSLLT